MGGEVDMHPPGLGLWIQCTSQAQRRKYRSRANLDAISIVDAKPREVPKFFALNYRLAGMEEVQREA